MASFPHFSERLRALRAALAAQDLAAFIVPKADEFQNEAVPPYADRLAWLTGFSGSAGTSVVLAEQAALIVDSRYTLQAKAQVDPDLFTVVLWGKTTAARYLSEAVASGAKVGFDPKLHTRAGFKKMQEEADKRGFDLVPCAINPIDTLWRDGRPKAHYAPIVRHCEKFAGEAAAAKIARVQDALTEKNCAGAFVAAPDSIAWLLNIRGGDVRHTPVALTRAFMPSSGKPVLFVQEAHLTPDNKTYLEDLAQVRPLEEMPSVLQEAIPPGARILVDDASATVWIGTLVADCNADLVEAPDPCVALKAVKNAVELEGARQAHARDGVALCRFLCWLEEAAASGELDEIAASDRLEAFRRETGVFKDLSFDTISGAGANGAIVHYRATPETNACLQPGSLYLIDSGTQYEDGTTDVTRTVAIGTPTADMRRHFTLVLKGHIGISSARFPKDTRGVDLDPFARRPLWEAGLDYGHGTGHGIGSYLSVHEGPQSISRNGKVALEAGMILSNEPGYYREGHYGIRIENLLVVCQASPVEGGDIPMMGFEVLTLAPIDRRLIAAEMLIAAERAWIDAYHRRVLTVVGPHLSANERAWLEQTTQPL